MKLLIIVASITAVLMVVRLFMNIYEHYKDYKNDKTGQAHQKPTG